MHSAPLIIRHTTSCRQDKPHNELHCILMICKWYANLQSAHSLNIMPNYFVLVNFSRHPLHTMCHVTVLMLGVPIRCASESRFNWVINNYIYDTKNLFRILQWWWSWRRLNMTIMFMTPGICAKYCQYLMFQSNYKIFNLALCVETSHGILV